MPAWCGNGFVGVVFEYINGCVTTVCQQVFIKCGSGCKSHNFQIDGNAKSVEEVLVRTWY